MKKKILITGTYCSGKTTLWSDIKSVVSDAVFIPEEARELVELIPSINWSETAIRDYLIVRQITVEKIAEKANKLIICDNGIHSNLAHDVILNSHINNFSLIEQLSHRKYDYIFFCDHSEIDVISDGVRLTQINLREEIANKILHYINLLNGQPIIVSGNRDERVNTVLSYII